MVVAVLRAYTSPILQVGVQSRLVVTLQIRWPMAAIYILMALWSLGLLFLMVLPTSTLMHSMVAPR